MDKAALTSDTASRREVRIASDGRVLQGELIVPPAAQGIVLFAHGSGSSRHSPRNRFVARVLQDASMATLLFDLLTPDEEAIDEVTAQLRFDIPMLAERLQQATGWAKRQPDVGELPVGYFGASTGGGAALVAAAALGEEIGAVVSRGGRPDLALDVIPRVSAATLLIVGGLDEVVIRLNEKAYAALRCTKELKIVPGATHLFEESGTLDIVADYAAAWFGAHLRG